MDFNTSQTVNLVNRNEFEANSRSVFSPKQISRLSVVRFLPQLLRLLIPLILSVVVFVQVRDNFTPESLSLDDPSSLVFSIIGHAIAFLLFVVFLQQIADILNYKAGAPTLFAWPAIRNDMQNRGIRVTQGSPVFINRRRYVFRSSHGDLVLPDNLNSGLIPGALYQVYYLEQSRVVLSAQPAREPDQQQVISAVQNILYQAFRFGPAELAANQTGEMTPSQNIGKLGIQIGASILAVVFSVLLFVATISRPESLPLPPLMMYLAALGCGLIGAWMLVLAMLDLGPTAVQQVAGIMKKEVRRIENSRGRGAKHYLFSINDLEFDVNQKNYIALVENLQYQVYYLKHTKIVLSIEVTGL